MDLKRLAHPLSIVCFATLFWWPPTAEASFVEDLTVAELTARATAVVHGNVVDVESAWDESHTRIFTTVTLEVIAYLAGEGPQTVTIRQVGGRVGDTELWVEGQPSFTVGERVVAFIEPSDATARNTWIVVAMALGKFTVHTDRTTGELVLERNLRGLTPVRLTPEGMRPAGRRMRVARPLLLRDLIREVRSASQGGRP